VGWITLSFLIQGFLTQAERTATTPPHVTTP
jgi:hypothetical protein